MNDPHVARLTYRIDPAHELLDFTATSLPAEFEVGTFACRVEEKEMIVTPREHFASEEEATAVLEPKLRAWEAYGEIVSGARFEFVQSAVQVVDRDPPPDVIAERGTSVTRVRSDLTIAYNIRWSPPNFPPPAPEWFVETEAVSRLKGVLRRQREGRYPLLAAAYDVFTQIKAHFGGGDEREAARVLNVSANVLAEVRKLSARNDPEHGRAVKQPDSPPKPITAEDEAFLKQALTALVEYAAHADGGAPAESLLALGDLRSE
ncbi:MAG: hypothetical protein WKF33_06275 [Thermoleophilaceae bacterium]